MDACACQHAVYIMRVQTNRVVREWRIMMKQDKERVHHEEIAKLRKASHTKMCTQHTCHTPQHRHTTCNTWAATHTPTPCMPSCVMYPIPCPLACPCTLCHVHVPMHAPAQVRADRAMLRVRNRLINREAPYTLCSHSSTQHQHCTKTALPLRQECIAWAPCALPPPVDVPLPLVSSSR